MLFSLFFSATLLESYLWNGIQPTVFQCACCEGGWPWRYSGTLMCALRAGCGRWDLWKFSNPQGLDQQTWVRSFPLSAIIFLEEFTLWKSFASSCTCFFNLETTLSPSIHLSHIRAFVLLQRTVSYSPLLTFLKKGRIYEPNTFWLSCARHLVMLNPNIFSKDDWKLRQNTSYKPMTEPKIPPGTSL